jgi:hypothetical protein
MVYFISSQTQTLSAEYKVPTKVKTKIEKTPEANLLPLFTILENRTSI